MLVSFELLGKKIVRSRTVGLMFIPTYQTLDLTPQHVFRTTSDDLRGKTKPDK